jgi:hypothetical protein
MFARNGGFTAASRKGDVENEIELSKMSEIDPQSGDPLGEARLTEALRHLAGSSRQGAPAEIGAGLVTAFRRHHTRRRRIRFAGMAALAACVALITGLMSMRPHSVPGKEQAHTEAGSVPGKAPNAAATTNTVAAQPRPAGTPVRAHAATSKAATSKAASSRQFIALPGYDPAVPADELHVVRVQLPASALWQMGAPVNPDSDGRRVLADFVVSQDGTPYAMRLVQ